MTMTSEERAAKWFEWWDGLVKSKADNIAWLNENANHIATDWSLWHSGGGCHHYYAEGHYRGQECYFLLCHDSVAESDWRQIEPMWCLSANALDSDGETTASAVLADGFCDGRSCVFEANMDAKWETF